jgi:hypothetical protein
MVAEGDKKAIATQYVAHIKMILRVLLRLVSKSASRAFTLQGQRRQASGSMGKLELMRQLGVAPQPAQPSKG